MALSHKLVLISVLIGAILIIIPTAEAALITSAGSGNWNSGLNWNGGIPGPGDDVIISHTINLDSIFAANISTLGLNNGGILTFAPIDGNQPASLNVTGNVTINSGGNITLGNRTASMGSLFIASGGVLAANQSLNITNGNFTNNGAFRHGSGIISFSNPGVKQFISGDNETTFFNLNATKNTVQVQNITIEGVLEVAPNALYTIDSTNKNMYLTFGNVSGGLTKLNISTQTNTTFNLTGSNSITIQGANAMHQPQLYDFNLFNYSLTNSSAALNLKWVHIFTSTNKANLMPESNINITGNITFSDASISGIFGPQYAQSINITQPGTNITFMTPSGKTVNWNGTNNTYIVGSVNSPIHIHGYNALTLSANSGGKMKIQHAVFSGVTYLFIQSNNSLSQFPTSVIIDNITVNSTGTAAESFRVENFTRTDVLISNSTISVPTTSTQTQIVVQNSNVTCIQCNFTRAFILDSGYMLSINATNNVNGAATNNTQLWGIAHSNSLNSTFGANLEALAGATTNLTLMPVNTRYYVNMPTTNTTLIVAGSATLGNITLGNGTFLNITTGTLTSNSEIKANGTITVSAGATLTAATNASVFSEGNLQGPGTFNLNNLDISAGGHAFLTGSTLNITDGNLTNYGTFVQTSGLTYFGGGAQHIRGTNVFSIPTLETGGSGSSIVVANLSLGVLNIRNGAEINISASNITFTGTRTLNLDGKINVLDGQIINATYNTTIFNLNASNIYLANVASLPQDTIDINNVAVSSVSDDYLNISNLSAAPYLDLNFTYDIAGIDANDESRISIYKFNDSDSNWYGLGNASWINTTSKTAVLENFTQVGSVFAPLVSNPTTATTSSTTTQTNGGNTGESTTTNINSITGDAQTTLLEDVNAGETNTVNVNQEHIPITEVLFTTLEDYFNVKITIETFNDILPEGLGELLGEAYDYMFIDTDQFLMLDGEAAINFEVQQEWLELFGIDKTKLKLYKWDEEINDWRELDTLLKAEDESVIEFQSLSDELEGYYAVATTGEKPAPPNPLKDMPQIDLNPSQAKIASNAIWIAALIAFLYAVYAARQTNLLKKKKKHRWRAELRTRKKKR